jgi:pimeloyl-ACP methyl ester carboxylesterase
MQTLGTSWGNAAYSQRSGSDEGPTLVFLHGTGCDSIDWRGLQRHLPSTISTVSFDFRGHGESSVPDEDFDFSDLTSDIHLLLEILAVNKPLIVGHSLGGMVGIELSTMRSLAGLVLVEGWTRLVHARAAYQTGPRFGSLTAEQIQEVERKRDATMARFTGDQWRAFWHSVTAYDGSTALDTIECPVFELYGTDHARPDTRERLGVPERSNIHFEWIESCGHYIHYERPESVAKICIQAHQTCR